VLFGGEKVHGAALAPGASGELAEQFGHERRRLIPQARAWP
jgi:hypothetical protein